jgi:transcription elongation GreA/GreB family factor
MPGRQRRDSLPAPARVISGQARQLVEQPRWITACGYQAVSQLTAVGLGVRIEHTADCIDPGHVIDQTPAAGTSVAPGSTVTFTIDDGTSGIVCR